MKKSTFSEENLRNAAAEVREAMVNDPALDAMETPRCSEVFQKNMHALLRKNRCKVNAMIGFKRAMAACLALVLCMGAWLAVDVDAREDVIDWAKNLLNYGHAEYERVGQLPPDSQLPELVAYYLPSEDYKEIRREYDGNKCTVTYKGDAEDSLFSISYTLTPETFDNGNIVFHDIPGTTDIIFSSEWYQLHTPEDSTQCKNLGWFTMRMLPTLEISLAYYFDDETAVRIANHIMTREQAEELTLPIKYFSPMPDGFEIWSTDYTSDKITHYYRFDVTDFIDAERKLALSYHRLGDPGEFYDETRYQKLFTETTVQIGGKDARLYTYNKGNTYSLLMWDDGQLEYELMFDGIDVETAIKMAESIQ